jgi:methyl-accepting chemotaxis protein
LAQRSAEAAKEIKALISASTAQVKDGVNLVGRTGEALTAIVARVSEISVLMTEINASTQEQSTALAQVNTAVNQMDQVTQQNAAMVEQSTAASHSLTQEAQELATLVGRFHVSEDGQAAKGAAGVRPVARPIPRALPRTAGALALKTPAEAEWEEF